MKETSRDPTRRFSDRVAYYTSSRPGYPEGVIDILRIETGFTSESIVADIGSGTGISTELFLRNGNVVYAVEPNPDMRSEAERVLSRYESFRSIDGTAESTTLPEKSVDYIAAGQAFHWFHPAGAKREFSRIITSGGWGIFMWNTRRLEATAFLRAYEELLQRFGTDYRDIQHTRNDNPVPVDIFKKRSYQRHVLYNEQLFDREGLQRRLLSSSYVPAPGQRNHEAMMQELDIIFHTHQEHGKVRFEYDTEIFLGKLG